MAETIYPRFQWQMAHLVPPDSWQQQVTQWVAAAGKTEMYAPLIAQLLWQRGWRDLSAIRGGLNVDDYQPTSPFAFGAEMDQAIARLSAAYANTEKVAIWGDFDADGLTATAVLWEGLGQFFSPTERLRYYIPNRFTESHGLSLSGLESLAAWGCNLIITCDTGSTATAELLYAATMGMEVIVTDHHTLAERRPPVVALINPRQLAVDHPLRELSGVAVAYKLIEALYDRLPQVPQQSLETLLDLVAIGLIADLVALRGDCRYLTQKGLQTLEAQAKAGVRPGITKLLELCKRRGDRPSDVAFGLGPRINAVSRIHGDAGFGVELLTSRDRSRAEALALEAELANTRRKALQASVAQQAAAKLAALDLSTTQVILLSDPQWSPGVLGLVASQIAQEYDRPTILFQTETTAVSGQPLMARGSARSVHQIDLYELVKAQSHLLTSFGGHPFAAGMTLPVDNLSLLADGLNRAVRSHLPTADLTQKPALAVDSTVKVADLGRDLFRALKVLEPYGMGNPIPKLRLTGIAIANVWQETLTDRRGGKQRYHKLSFDIVDPQTQATFPGHWWGHRRADLPEGVYDIVVELDVNTYKKRYEVRLIDLCPTTGSSPAISSPRQLLVDRRAEVTGSFSPPAMLDCPTDWSDFSTYRAEREMVTLAYPPPTPFAPEQQWQQLLGIAKYLARSGQSRPTSVLKDKLGLSDRTLQAALAALQKLGCGVQQRNAQISVTASPTVSSTAMYDRIAQNFLTVVQEERFRQQYFYEVPVNILEQTLGLMDDSAVDS